MSVQKVQVTLKNIEAILDEIISIMKENNVRSFQSRWNLPDCFVKYNRKRKYKKFNIDENLLKSVCNCLILIGLSADSYTHKYYSYFRQYGQQVIKLFFLFKTELVMITIRKLKSEYPSNYDYIYSLDIGMELRQEILYPISDFELLLENYWIKESIKSTLIKDDNSEE